MSLTNMKLSKKEVEKEAGTIEEEAPRYPWGLSINLDNESIEKLGITTLPEVGDLKTLIAVVKVKDVSETDSIEGKKQRNIGLQITEMSIEEKIEKAASKTLYGDNKK